jgi:hypothetical protein
LDRQYNFVYGGMSAAGQKPTSPFCLWVRFFHEPTFAMQLSEVAIGWSTNTTLLRRVFFFVALVAAVTVVVSWGDVRAEVQWTNSFQVP